MTDFYKKEVELSSQIELPTEVDFTQGVTVESGYYWMTSNRDRTISKLTFDLEVLFTFEVSSETTLPLGIAHDGDHLWVVGTEKDAVFKYTEQGVYTGVSFSTLNQVTYADGICFDGDHFWVVGTGNFFAYQYTLAGVYTGVKFALQVLSGTGTVRDITWDGSSFWVINSTGEGDGLLHRYDRNGTYLSEESQVLGNHGLFAYNNQLHVVGSADSQMYIYDIEETVLDYQNTILKTDGLLAYYPLYVDGKERSGKHIDMTVYGSVDFNNEQEKVSPEGVGSYASELYDTTYSETKNTIMVEAPSGIQCVELWCQFEFEPDVYHGVFHLNSGFADNTLRIQLAGRLTDEFSFYCLGTPSYILQNQNRMASPTHVCVQYEESTGKTTLFLDGEIASDIHDGNVFNSLVDGGLMGAGCFTVYGNADYIRTYGGSNTSDFAVYDRPLTRAEIWQRAKYGSYEGMILGTDGLQSYWKLDGVTDSSGNGYDLIDDGVTFGTGDIISVSKQTRSYQSELELDSEASYVYMPNIRSRALIDTESFEAWAKLPNGYVDGVYLSIISASSEPFVQGSTKRCFLTTFPDGRIAVLNNLESSVFSIFDQTIFKEAVHVVWQYERSINKSVVYFNGVIDNSLSINGNIFSGKVDTCYVTPSSWFNNENSCNGGLQISEMARYNRPLLQYEITARVKGGYSTDPIFNLLLSLSSITWGNRETRAQANPQPIYLANHISELHSYNYVVKNNPFHNDIIQNQQGDIREYGYIKSKTEVSGIPVGNKRVMLFAHNSAALLAETVSDSSGNYRFDSLLMGKKYMITAQYGNADENTSPDYSATTLDWQTPTSYKDS